MRYQNLSTFSGRNELNAAKPQENENTRPLPKQTFLYFPNTKLPWFGISWNPAQSNLGWGIIPNQSGVYE